MRATASGKTKSWKDTSVLVKCRDVLVITSPGRSVTEVRSSTVTLLGLDIGLAMFRLTLLS
jgi:hypothetical protein